MFWGSSCVFRGFAGREDDEFRIVGEGFGG